MKVKDKVSNQPQTSLCLQIADVASSEGGTRKGEETYYECF